MKYLVYGILDARQAEREALPPGLGQRPLTLVEHGHLAVALSPVAEGRASPAGLEQAVEYAQVVEQLHRRVPVLPMRYGSFVHRPEQAVEFLRRHEREFADALAEVGGREEMGIRVLIPHPHVTGTSPPAGASAEVAARSRGAAYLAGRRQFYAQQELLDRSARRVAEQARAAFAGTFIRSRWEHVTRPNGQVVSLAFLVERPRVAEFLEAFRRFQQASPGKVMCSGPWPPYGFVADLAKPAMPARADLELLRGRG